MTRIILVPALFLCAAVAADDDPRPTSPADKLAALKKTHADADDAYRKAMAALPETAEGEKKAEELWKAHDKAQLERFQAAYEIAKADPKSDVGFAALEWALTIPRTYFTPVGKPALELATEHHAANPKVGKMVAWVGYYHRDDRADSYAAAKAFVKAVAEKNPDRAARGQAVMCQAWDAGRAFAVAERKKSPDAEKLAVAAEKAFEGVVKDYADCPRLMRDGQRTLGEEAKQELYELRYLRVGKTAPEMEGDAVEGAKFKLSDHRGKVVVVNFWASWCGPCMAMVPHEREMVAKFKDKPFVIVGVNGDDERTKAQEVMTKEKMTWPSFWNGDKGPDGPLSRAWNVRGWPTIYVLDAKGVIRAKNLRGKELETAVEELLKEMEGKK
jgi:thiol-disulfide isomerase/thioredoxin